VVLGPGAVATPGIEPTTMLPPPQSVDASLTPPEVAGSEAGPVPKSIVVVPATAVRRLPAPSDAPQNVFSGAATAAEPIPRAAQRSTEVEKARGMCMAGIGRIVPRGGQSRSPCRLRAGAAPRVSAR
jgi:hypothetical protein